MGKPELSYITCIILNPIQFYPITWCDQIAKLFRFLDHLIISKCTFLLSAKQIRICGMPSDAAAFRGARAATLAAAQTWITRFTAQIVYYNFCTLENASVHAAHISIHLARTRIHTAGVLQYATVRITTHHIHLVGIDLGICTILGVDT